MVRPASPLVLLGDGKMLKTDLCDLFGIEVPIILAPMGTCTSAELAAAVSNEGGLGGVGSLFRNTAAIKRDIDMVRKLTSRPFAINHIPQTLDAEAFRYTLDARPAVVSFALGDPEDLVRQVHDVGSLVMLQVTTVAQAVLAADRGVDVIIAQGGEAGGYCGEVSTMTLVPQVVDAVSPIPVVAAGGIFDGRGIAAALMLGAVGVNLGTRFIAATEAPAPDEWKQAITAAKSEDAIKVDVLNDISPLPGTVGFNTVLRSLHTAFVDEWSGKREAARRERDRLRDQIVSTTQAGRPHACLLTAGQTAGGITEVLSVGDIMRRLIAETEAALSRAPDHRSTRRPAACAQPAAGMQQAAK
jgi:nitronate monooxygenase/enoyl-[acyl-carrier protein] reductase II